MEFATGALGTLLPKLGQLLLDEYNLHKGAKKNIKFLREELQSIQAALHSVGEVPLEQLSEPVKIWANDARELSYDMEDIVDTFMVRIQGPDPPRKKGYKKFFKKMSDMVTKAKTQHEIGQDINDIKERVKEVAARRQRYELDYITPAKTSGLDPRVASLYTKVADLVGIDEAREELISRLTIKGDDNMAAAEQRIVSIVGFGGLGKTTLAKAVYDKLKGQIACNAFVPIGRNPDLKKVFKDILIDLHKQGYMHFNLDILDERQLIDKLRESLEKKRYFIVIDDIWDTKSWETIKLALVDNNSGSRVIITTRTHEVAIKAGGLYKLQQLSYDNSRKLFLARICGGNYKSSDRQPADEPYEITEKILRKCEGVPLAIITMASLLEGKPREEWSEVYRSIGFGNKENQQVENTMKILSLGYYDLPPHLRTCLLHLSVFPEDYFIEKNPLIWMWIAEDFVHKEQERSSYEIGEEYFNHLVNRSLIQLVEKWDNGRKSAHGCHIHDMVLDLIRSISSELNFVTILDKNEGMSLSQQGRSVRRLALQNNRTTEDHMEGMKQVRSLISCGYDVDKRVPLSSFQLIRVLSIDASNHYIDQRCHLKHLRNLLHLRYLRLSNYGRNSNIAEEIGTLKFLQTLDVQGEDNCNQIVRSLGLLTKLLCLRLRDLVRVSITTIPDGIRKLTSLEELEIFLDHGREQEALRRFIKALGSLRALRVLRLVSSPISTEVQIDVMESLRNLEKLEHLSLQMEWATLKERCWDTSALEAAGFFLSRRLRLLFITWISFTRFPSSCINPCRLGYLSHLSLSLDAISEQELTILGMLPELRFLDLTLKSTTEMKCNTTAAAATDAAKRGEVCLFQKLRHFNLNYSESVWLLLSKDDESSRASFRIECVHASVLLGSEWEGVCSGGALMPTLMPRVQKLSFTVDAQGFNKNNENPDGGCSSLCLEDLASLQRIEAYIDCMGADDAEVEEAEAALRGVPNVHPNHPKLDMIKYWD